MQRSAINYTRLVFKPTRQNMHAHTSLFVWFSYSVFLLFKGDGWGGKETFKSHTNTNLKKIDYGALRTRFVSMDHPKGDSVCAILFFFFCLAFLFCAQNVARSTIAVCTPKYNLILSTMTAATMISKNDNKQKQTFLQRLKSTNTLQCARDWQVSYFFRTSTFIYFEHFVSVCFFLTILLIDHVWLFRIFTLWHFFNGSRMNEGKKVLA